MNKNYPLDDLRKLLSTAQNFFVLLPKSASFDQVASALALFLALEKSGKQVSVLSPDEMLVEFSHVVGVDRVTGQIPQGEMVITVNVPLENIEKVTSGDEGQRLHLTIRPKPGTPSLKKEDLLFSSSGALAEALFVFEVRQLESLGKIYEENRNLFQEKPLVNVSHYPKAEPFGKINIIDPSASCCSELTLGLIVGLGLPVDEDVASNLLLGLKNGTQNFGSSQVGADTFEAAAFCLRHGAGSLPVETKEANPQPDWLEPKIYKGSTIP